MRTAGSGTASVLRQCVANLTLPPPAMAGLPEAAAERPRERASGSSPRCRSDWVEQYFQIVKALDRTIYIQGLRAAGLE